MATISSLYVELKLSAENFNNGLRDAQREAREFEKNIKPTINAAKELGEAMSVVGDVVAIAMVEMTKKTAEYGAALEHAAQRTGASVQELSKLDFAAKQSGSSTEGMNTALKFLAKNMELAETGSKKQATAFKDLGISTADLKAAHGDVAEVMKLVSDKFHGLDDDAAKTTVSLTLFGKGGTELIPLLNQGSSAIAAMGDTAERLGLVMTDEAAASSVVFEQTLNQLTASVEGVGISIGTALMPMLTSVAATVRDGVTWFNDFAKAHEEVTRVVFLAAAAIGGAGGLLLGLTGVLLVLPQITEAFELLTGPIGLTIAAVALLVTGVVYFRNEIKTGLVAILATLVLAFESMLKSMSTVADAIGPAGLALKIHNAANAVQDFRTKLDASVVAGMAQTQTLAKTTTELNAEKLARTSATQQVAKHTLALSENTAEADKAQKKIDEAKKKIDELVTNAGIGLAKMLTAQEQANNNWIEKQGALWSKAQDTINRITQANAATMRTYEDNLGKTSDAWITVESKKFSDGLQGQIDMSIGMMKGWDDNAKKANADAVASVKESAGKIFDDMFIKGQSVFSSLQNLLKGGALSLGRSIFEDISGALLGPIKLAFDDFFKGLLESTGIKSFIEGLGKKLGGALSGIMGGGGGFVGPTLQQAGGAASGIAGTAMSTTTSLAGSLISGGIAAAGAIIGSLIQKGNLKATEENTRETRDWLELQTVAWNPLFFGMLQLQQTISDSVALAPWTNDTILNAAEGLRIGIYNALWEVAGPIVDAIKSIPGAVQTSTPPPGATAPRTPAAVTSVVGNTQSQLMALFSAGVVNGVGTNGPYIGQRFTEGGYAQRTGPAWVEQGELMIPKHKQGGMGVTVNINIANVHGTDRAAAKNFARMISEEVKSGSIRLLASEVKR